MNYQDYQDDEFKLVDTINKISSQINFSNFSSANSSIHSEFLLEVIEDMEKQLHKLRQQNALHI